MSNPLKEVRAFVESRTRDEWRAAAVEKWTEVRIWIQENGEGSFVLGIVLGLFAVIAFRFVVFTLLFLAAIVALIWYFAPIDKSALGRGQTLSHDQDLSHKQAMSGDAEKDRNQATVVSSDAVTEDNDLNGTPHH